MNRIIATLLTLLATTASSHAETSTVSFVTTDGVTVYGEVYRSNDVAVSAPLILSFHQGASNGRAEYEPLVPTLLAHGYNAIAIDQRRGGERFGGMNRTLAGVADPGVHGSSMLNEMRVAASTEATWAVVLAFLAISLEKGTCMA